MMAQPCISTSPSAASIRINTLPFSSANPSSCFETTTLSLSFPRRSRKFGILACDQSNARNYYIVKGPTSMYSGERWEPETSSRRGIWSIRDDVQIPSSPYLPLNVQGCSGPSPGFLGGLEAVSAKLFQNRIIRCGGEVNDAMANYLVAQLLYLDAVDPTKDIIMYVNSPGGSVKAGMAIFDMMRHVRPDVSTVCVGLAASMGAFLLGAGTKGKRYSLPDSRIMIHQPLGGAQGFGTDIDVQADEMSHCKASLTTYLALFCGQELFKVYNDTDKDNFMSPQEAKVYGLIDGILMNPLKALRPLAASADSADE